MNRVSSALLLAVATVACGGERPATAEERGTPLVVALDQPLAWAARRLVGDAARVVMPVPPHMDPLHWIPDDDAIGLMQRADLVLLDHTGTQAWLATAPLPTSRVVDTTAGLGERLLAAPGGPAHRHGLLGEHSHGDLAGTAWLDPTLFAARLWVQADALAALLPDRRAAIHREAEAIEARLLSLDERLAAAVALDPTRPLLASHPVYEYLAARHGVALRSLHWEPDREPTEAEWQALGELLAEHPARSMLWEAEPLPAVRARLDALGVACEVYAPCGSAPIDGADLLDVMDANAAALERAYRR